MKIVKNRNIKLEITKKGEQIRIDSEVYFDVLYPEDTLALRGLNNNSLVLKLNYGGFKMLFTGDIEKEAETKILESYKKSNVLNVTAIKIAHHGSKTSTTEEFLDMASPQIALIRCG